MGLLGSQPSTFFIEKNLKLLFDEGEMLNDHVKYRRLIGHLIYPTIILLDIMYLFHLLSRFMQAPWKSHYEVALRRGRGSYRGRGRGRGRQNVDKSTIECYNCHELGHYQYECPQKDKEAKANYAEASEEMLLMVYTDT
ncbi:hypothetical protein EV1_007905 [Malus domestica]